jgi:hypothetical protein
MIGSQTNIATVVDWNVAYNYLTVSGNVTFTFSNAANGKTVTVAVVGDGSTRVLTWPSPIKWGVSGTVYKNLTLNKSNIYTFTQINGVVYGAVTADMTTDMA